MGFNKKYLGIPLGAILLLVMIATVTAASLVVVYETTLTGQVTVEETASDNTYEITIYKTNACEQEISSIDLGSGKPGDIYFPGVYIKNTGDSYISHVHVQEVNITSEGWNTSFHPGYDETLEVGEVKEVGFRVYIHDDAKPGNYSGEIKIVAKAENNE